MNQDELRLRQARQASREFDRSRSVVGAVRGWANDALCQPETRAKFHKLLNLGLTDAIASSHPEPGNYTFWDYQARAWPKNHGWRIDHILLSAQAMSALANCGIDKQLRGKDKPSDHVPVCCELEL